jgi:predicted nucleotidyltransferase
MGRLKINEDLSFLFASHPAILAAYLFGSTANQSEGAKSDVDVALRLDQGLSVDQQMKLRFDLMDDVETHFKRSADIVILNNASLKMIRQVLTRGELLFARDERAERLYAILKQKEYFDFKYYIEKDRQELKSFFGVA